MKAVKYILIVFVSILLLMFVSALFVSKKYKVARSITINKPKTEIFNYIKYLKNQDEYSKWAKMDANMRKVYSGKDATAGFKSAWSSDNSDVGKGEQEIVKITDGQQVDYKIRFEEPMKDVASSFMRTDSIAADKTLVKWEISGNMTYPLNLMGLIMDKMIGGDIEIGLSNLKKIQESN